VIEEVFDIRFVDDDGAPESTRFSEIVIGGFRERFLTDLSFWSEADYERQWREAVSQVMTLDRAALMASMTDPSNANFIRWWVMYREGETVMFQDQLFFMSEAKEPFVTSATSRFIHDRGSVSDTGYPVSEWSTTTSALRAFLRKTEAK
jgi:hypothetical protein